MLALYGVPTALLLFAAIALAVTLACGGQVIVDRRYRDADAFDYKDAPGPPIAVVGTLYGVVLGFVTVVTWQQFDATRERVALETASIADAWHNAVGLPPATRTVLRHDMLQYSIEMTNAEWPLMKTGRFSPLGDELIMHATMAVGTARIAGASAANAQQATLHLLTDLHDARSRRLAGNHSGLSWFEWTALFLGAATVIALCWVYGVRGSLTHQLMTGSVAVIIATMFVLIFELQYPFRSDIGIDDTMWRATIAHIRVMDKSSMPEMHMGETSRSTTAAMHM